MWIPEIITVSDYDGYFTDLVKEWCYKKITPFKSQVIRITAGPYRGNAVTCQRKGDDLHIDFYSALRNGFGGLSQDDVNKIIEKWI